MCGFHPAILVWYKVCSWNQHILHPGRLTAGTWKWWFWSSDDCSNFNWVIFQFQPFNLPGCSAWPGFCLIFPGVFLFFKALIENTAEANPLLQVQCWGRNSLKCWLTQTSRAVRAPFLLFDLPFAVLRWQPPRTVSRMASQSSFAKVILTSWNQKACRKQCWKLRLSWKMHGSWVTAMAWRQTAWLYHLVVWWSGWHVQDSNKPRGWHETFLVGILN